MLFVIKKKNSVSVVSIHWLNEVHFIDTMQYSALMKKEMRYICDDMVERYPGYNLNFFNLLKKHAFSVPF